MKKIPCKKPQYLKALILPALSVLPGCVMAGAEDDPLLTKVLIDQLEFRESDQKDIWVLDGQGWIGQDLQKIWFKSELGHTGSETEEAELQALYSRAVSPYWDVQVGLRRDFQPTPSRRWAVIGFQGLAPYFFEIDSALFIGESGRTALRLEAEYELLFTQKLILTPEIEVNIFGQNDADLGIGSGLSDIEAGLRLRYEIRREFAPYIGINWSKKYGNTANFIKFDGENVEGAQLVFGIKAWF